MLFFLTILSLSYSISPFCSFSFSVSPPFLPSSLSTTLTRAKLFLAREKKVFTLWPRPAGITLCSHWLNPLLPLYGLHIFPVLQDFVKKRTQGDKEREKVKEKSAASPFYYMWIFSGSAPCVRVCVCTWRWFMYKQEHQQSDNKFFRGLWTLQSPVVSRATQRSHWITGNCSYWLLPSLAEECTDFNANYRVWTCGYTVQIGSYTTWSVCKILQKCSGEMCRQTNK